MSLFEIGLRNISRRRLRTSLTLVGVAVGIAAFVALVGFSRSFEEQWLKIYQSSGTDLAVVEKSFLNTSVDESVGAKLRALPMVEDAQPMILNMLDITPDVNAIVYGYPADSYELDSLTLLSGRKFRDGAPEIMLGELLADNLGKKPGDKMEIQGETFEVVGVFRGGSALETAAALMLALHQLQELADIGPKATAFHVKVRGGGGDDRIAKARAAIEAALPG